MAVTSLTGMGPVAVREPPVFIPPAPAVSERSFEDFMKGMLKSARSTEEQGKTESGTLTPKQSFSPVERKKSAVTSKTTSRSRTSTPERRSDPTVDQENRATAERRPAAQAASESSATTGRQTDPSASASERDEAAKKTGPAPETAQAESGQPAVESEPVLAEAPRVDAEEPVAAEADASIQPEVAGELVVEEEVVPQPEEAVEPMLLTIADEAAGETATIDAPPGWEPPVNRESAGVTGTSSSTAPDGEQESAAVQAAPADPVAAAIDGEVVIMPDDEGEDISWSLVRRQALQAEGGATGSSASSASSAATTSATASPAAPVETEHVTLMTEDTVTLTAAEKNTQLPAAADEAPLVDPETEQPEVFQAQAETVASVRGSRNAQATTLQRVAQGVDEEVVALNDLLTAAPAPVRPDGSEGKTMPAQRKNATATKTQATLTEPVAGGEAETSEPVVMAAEAGAESSAGENQTESGFDLSGRAATGTTPAIGRETHIPFASQFQTARSSAPAAAHTAEAATMTAQPGLSEQLEKVERLQELVEQLDRHTLSLATGKDKTMSITLEPRSLGKVILNCRESGDRMAVEILTESPGVKQLLQQQESSVRSLLEDNGYKMGTFDVRTQEGGGDGSAFARQRGQRDENAETGGGAVWRGEVTGSPDTGPTPTHAARTAGGIWVVA